MPPEAPVSKRGGAQPGAGAPCGERNGRWKGGRYSRVATWEQRRAAWLAHWERKRAKRGEAAVPVVEADQIDVPGF